MKASRWLNAVYLVGTLLLGGCIWGQYFELGWDEDVALLDGRVIQVHVTHTYERTSAWSRYGHAIHRNTELRFDAGGTTGTMTQLFMGFSPMFLDQYQGVWYAVLYGGYRKGSREVPGQDWGDADGGSQWALKLDAGKWKPISMRELPEPFQRPNILLLHGPDDEAELDGTRVTLRRKEEWARQHPPSFVLLTRPTDKRSSTQAIPSPDPSAQQR